MKEGKRFLALILPKTLVKITKEQRKEDKQLARAQQRNQRIK